MKEFDTLFEFDENADFVLTKGRLVSVQDWFNCKKHLCNLSLRSMYLMFVLIKISIQMKEKLRIIGSCYMSMLWLM